MARYTAIYHTKGRRIFFPCANKANAIVYALAYGKRHNLEFLKVYQL
jgi:hypothetical protein